ncbi:TPA: hypothetical protein EYP13_02720 [Candidatus Micrarchaeota archaeon]|nr:hypothetical protein [Candidatus Micrarchaeota archaeon]
MGDGTGNYDLLVPLALSSTIAFLLSGKWSLYEKQEESRLSSPAHRGEFIVDVLEDIFRGVLYTDDLRAVILEEGFADLKDLLLVPVLDEKGQRCLGTFSREELIKAYDREMLRRRRHTS